MSPNRGISWHKSGCDGTEAEKIHYKVLRSDKFYLCSDIKCFYNFSLGPDLDWTPCSHHLINSRVSLVNTELITWLSFPLSVYSDNFHCEHCFELNWSRILCLIPLILRIKPRHRMEKTVRNIHHTVHYTNGFITSDL